MSSVLPYLAVEGAVDIRLKQPGKCVSRGPPPGCEVRPEVLNSWVRCREIGLDPFSKNVPPSLVGNGLALLLRANSDLIELSKPVMEMIEISVTGSGFIVTLTDNNGHVLVAKGIKKIIEMAEANFYQPGCLRTNESAGTNAIGLCLMLAKPLQVTGAEHYKVFHHPWTCSLAPFFAGPGAISAPLRCRVLPAGGTNTRWRW